MCRSCSEIHSPMRYEVTIAKISGLRRPGARPPGPPGSINCLTSHLKYLFDTLPSGPSCMPGLAAFLLARRKRACAFDLPRSAMGLPERGHEIARVPKINPHFRVDTSQVRLSRKNTFSLKIYAPM